MLLNKKHIPKYLNMSICLLLIILLVNSCKKELFQGITEPDRIHTSNLLIRSTPDSLRIYVDDRFLGAFSPDTIRWLPSGSHKITLKHELYADTSFFVELINNETVARDIYCWDNPRFYGKLYIETVPSGASITLDDTITGFKTPNYHARILPGLHKIKLELEKHRSDSFSVKIKGDEYKNIIVNLEDTTKFVTYKTKNSKIISDYITSVSIDNDGLKYIGSFDKGIVTFDGHNWNEIKSEGAFTSPQINRIEIDRYNRLWVISNVNLLMRENNVWRNINNELGVETVTDISFDSFDNIWVASDRGLFNYNNNVWVNYNSLNSGITSDILFSVYCASNGDIWAGTLKRLVRFRNNEWLSFNTSRVFDEEQGVVSPAVVKIIEGNEGMIWFVHVAMQPDYRDAITALKDNRWEEKAVRYVIPSQINSLNSFKDGNIWFSTKNSTVLLKENGQVVNINSTNSGLLINMCMQIEKDFDGNFWIATMGNGLVLVKKGTIQ